MRILALAILAMGIASIGPAAAQTYDPVDPVCLRLYDSDQILRMPLHVAASMQRVASGRSAKCVINPYFGGAQEPADYRRHRRVY
jgi:hypothetical protein